MSTAHYAHCLEQLIADCHGAAERAGWWKDPITGQDIERSFPTLIALMHSELSEALEADRTGAMDDHLPAVPGQVAELIDLIIRACDTLGHLRKKFDCQPGLVYVMKRQYNDKRADHKLEQRQRTGGKKY